MLAFGIGYSLFLILFGLCAEPRWRYGGAVAVLLMAGPGPVPSSDCPGLG